MDPWKRLHNEFNKLMEEENRIVQQRGLSDWCYAYATGLESGTFDYSVESITNESLQVRFEGLATEAGIALGSPSGTLPLSYWLHRLFLDLRANDSPLIGIHNDNGGFIEHLLEGLPREGFIPIAHGWRRKPPERRFAAAGADRERRFAVA